MSRYRVSGFVLRNEETVQGKGPPPWGLSQRLLMKSLEVAHDDPGLAVRFANLAVRASILLQEVYDPFSALELMVRTRPGQAPEGAREEDISSS